MPLHVCACGRGDRVPAAEGTLVRAALAVADAAVGREGIAIERRWQMAVDGAGRRWLWRTRRRGPGQFAPSAEIAADRLRFVPR